MDIGTGSQITISEDSSGFIAEVLDITPPGGTRGVIQTSHMLTQAAHTFMATDLVDWGTVQFEMAFDPSKDPAPLLEAQTPLNFTITFPDGTAWVFQAWMTEYNPRVPLEDRMLATCSFKVSGQISHGTST